MGTEERLTIYFFAGVIVFIIAGFLYNKWEQKRATSYFKRKMENLFHNDLVNLKQLLKKDEAERDNLLDIITDFELKDEDAIEEIYNFLIELNVRKNLPLPPDERLREYCKYLLLFFSNNPYILTNI